MDLELMSQSPSGHLTRIAGTDSRTRRPYLHKAFIPHPLGEAPELRTPAWNAVVNATGALSRLDQVARVSGARDLAGWMSAPLLRLEAQSTSAIEGTFEPARAVLEADEEDAANQSAEMREILNYVRAARLCFTRAADGRRLTTGLLCELQGMLVDGTRSADRDPGRVRTGQVAIGSPTGSIDEARFVPMPPGVALEAAVSTLLDWEREAPARGTPDLVEVAMFHYQFETIHPFTDGNGRIGRMLVVHALMARGVLAEPLLTVSPWLERHDDEYRERLFNVSAHGDWSSWIEFFSTAVEQSSNDVLRKINSVVRIAEEMADAVKGSRAGSVQRRLPELLVRRPVVSARDVARELECTTPPAQAAIERLEALGFLTEVTGGNYGRRYSATRILDVLADQTTLD
ncbi:MAG: Fic family protein [Demequina sp.]